MIMVEKPGGGLNRLGVHTTRYIILKIVLTKQKTEKRLLIIATWWRHKTDRRPLTSFSLRVEEQSKNFMKTIIITMKSGGLL